MWIEKTILFNNADVVNYVVYVMSNLEKSYCANL